MGFNLWGLAISIRERELGREISRFMLNCLEHVAHIKSKKIDRSRFVIDQLGIIYQINRDAVYNSRNEWEKDLSFTVGVTHFLDIIRRETFPIELSKEFFNHLFFNIRLLTMENDQLFRDLIGHLTDGQFMENWISFPSSKLSRLSITARQKEKDDLNESIDFINDLRLRKIRITKENINLANKKIIYIHNQIKDKSNLRIVLTEKDVINLKRCLDQLYKARSVRDVVIYSLCHLIFQKKYDLVFYAFKYNQPDDSNATWTNTEIVPTSDLELMYLMEDQDTIEQRLIELGWPDHHGTGPYVRQLIFLAIFFNQRLKGLFNNKESDLGNVIENYCGKDLDKLEIISNRLYGISNSIKSFQEDDIYEFIYMEYRLWDELSKRLMIIAERLKGKIKRAPKELNIKGEEIEGFLNSTSQFIVEKSLIFNLFDKWRVKSRGRKVASLRSFNEEEFKIPRSYFLRKSNSYWNYDQTCSSTFANNFDSRTFNQLDEYLDQGELLHSTSVNKWIQKHSKKEQAIIFSGLSSLFFFHNQAEFVLEEDELSGLKGYYKDCPVFEKLINHEEHAVRIIDLESLKMLRINPVPEGFDKIGRIGYKYSDKRDEEIVEVTFLTQAYVELASKVGVKVDVDTSYKE
ncbi:hypothetical protein [Ekhidna sp.]|uniref:hypothetical protein n=1 Tax=Ekhidna sp. TaxID=2608089 RepID=UPI003C7ABF53